MDCPFCSEIKDPSYYVREVNTTWAYPDRLLWKNSGAIIFPGQGAQVCPYALVVPTAHKPSFMSLSMEERRPIFEGLDFLTSLSVCGEIVCVFEHGGGDKLGCQCIDHCHLHVIRAELGLVQTFNALPLGASSRVIVLDDQNHRRAPRSYLFAGLYRRGQHILCGSFVESQERRPQIFRQLLSETLGLDWFRWQDAPTQDEGLRFYRSVKP